MKYAFVILISMVLLVADGCAADKNCAGTDCAQARVGVPNDQTCAEVKPESKPTEEEQAMINARRWAKEGVRSVEECIKQFGSNRSTAQELLERSMLEIARLQALTGDGAGAAKTFERVVTYVEGRCTLTVSKVDYKYIMLREAGAGLHEMAMKTSLKMIHVGRDFVLEEMINAEVESGFYDNAVQSAQEMSTKKQEAGFWIVVRAAADAGNYEAAKRAALNMSGDKTAALAHIAVCEAKAGNKEAAEKTFGLAAEAVTQGSARDHLVIAQGEADAGMVEKAKATLDGIKEDYSKDCNLLIQAANIRIALGDKTGAVESLNKAKDLAKNDDDPDLRLCEIALAESKAADKKAALETFKRARETVRQDVCMFWRLRRIIEYKVKAGYYTEAKEDAKAFSDDREKRIALATIMHLEIEAGLYEQAEKTMALLGPISPEDKKGFYGLILLAQVRAGKFKEARKNLELVHDYERERYSITITTMEIDAGNTEHVEETIAEVLANHRGWAIMAACELMARTGQEARLTELYQKLKTQYGPRYQGPVNILDYCRYAAKGYLERVEDLQRAALAGR